METVNKDFKALTKQVAKLNALSGSNEYYVQRDVLVDMLIQFLRTEFTQLNKPNFLKLCDMVSTYRPVQPFSFLVSISIRKK